MGAAIPAGIVIAAVLLLPTAVVMGSFPGTLTLERGIPAAHKMELSELRERDRVRHRRMLQQFVGVVDFPVQGTFDPFRVG